MAAYRPKRFPVQFFKLDSDAIKKGNETAQGRKVAGPLLNIVKDLSEFTDRNFNNFRRSRSYEYLSRVDANIRNLQKLLKTTDFGDLSIIYEGKVIDRQYLVKLLSKVLTTRASISGQGIRDMPQEIKDDNYIVITREDIVSINNKLVNKPAAEVEEIYRRNKFNFLGEDYNLMPSKELIRKHLSNKK